MSFGSALYGFWGSRGGTRKRMARNPFIAQLTSIITYFRPPLSESSPKTDLTHGALERRRLIHQNKFTGQIEN